MEKLDTLRKWVEESNHIVFFGGAGVSTESGIPDFRSVDGLYRQNPALRIFVVWMVSTDRSLNILRK